MTMRKAIIYTRVSTGMQIENTSLEMQAIACERKAEEMQMPVVEVFSDPGVSGAKYLTRPGIQGALAALRSGQADSLIIYKMDRAGRDMDIIRKIRNEVLRAGCVLIFADGMNFENNATGNLTFNMMAGFAEFERDLIRERTMGGRRALAASGVQPSRKNPPFGYVIVTHVHKIAGRFLEHQVGDHVVIEEEAYWVREIFRLYAAHWSLGEIARHLNDQHVPTPKGGREWRGTSVRCILMNSVYSGRVAFGKTLSVADETLTYRHDPTKLLKNGRRVQERPEEEWTDVTEIPALIDPQTWAQCAALLAQNMEEKQAIHGGNPDRKFALSSLIFCPVCGFRVCGNTDKRVSVRTYVCHKRPGCRKPSPRYRADLLESLMTKALLILHKHPTLVEDTIRAYDAQKRAEESGSERERKRAQMEAELQTLQERGQAAAKAMTAAVMAGGSAEDFTGILQEINTRRQTIEAKLKECAPVLRIERTPSARDIAAKLADVAGAIVKVFTASEQEFSAAEKRALLLPLVDRIVPDLNGEAIRVSWKTETLQNITIYCIAVLSR